MEYRNKYWLHILLFVLSFFTTAVAGVFWAGQDPFNLQNLGYGLTYATAILAFLSAHEFGHYFAARFHGVRATLPYYIPFPPMPGLINFGTLGAVIKTKSLVPSRKVMFDIGVAGPIAGFIVAMIILAMGFATLPGKDFVLAIHPHYDFAMNEDPTAGGYPLEFGQTIIYWVFQHAFTPATAEFIPPMSEIYHYPLLCVGWFGLFVTALNLIPIGQFDGGHIVYGMFGTKHRYIARISFSLLLLLGLPSLVDTILNLLFSLSGTTEIRHYLPWAEYSWSGWLFWAFISLVMVKLDHPPVPDESELGPGRTLVGWIAILIFVGTFSFIPFTIPL